MQFKKILAKKPLFYKTFDPLRMQKSFDLIKDHLNIPKIIHVIGTNGKGTTGRFLAQMLRAGGVCVGHYTSPHITHFNERFWLDGVLATDQMLEDAYQRLKIALDAQSIEALSYFELSTFLAVFLYQKCDYIVLEAGLGGAFDATSVFPNILTLITPIGLDHQAFLGATYKEVVSTKLAAIQKQALIALQSPEAKKAIQNYQDETNTDLLYFNFELLGDEDQALIEAFREREGVEYLAQNLSFALWAFRKLQFQTPLREENIEILFGRMTLFRKNIRMDVGHNTLAAERICNFYGNLKVNLVYNTLEDKDYKSIIKILKPILKKVYILPIEDQRALRASELEAVLCEEHIDFEPFSTIDQDETYLVFGSFVVIETFLKRVNG